MANDPRREQPPGAGLPAPAGLPWREGLRYGALGAPLAFVALPLYVQWPALASQSTGLSLAAVGAMLLVMRCLDAAVDPWLGQRVDAYLSRSRAAVLPAMALGCAAMTVGFGLLFIAPGQLLLSPSAWVAGCVTALALTYLGFSFAQIAHQAWGARLGGGEAYRAQVVGARELFALVGVAIASVAPSVLGWEAITLLLLALLVVGLALLAGAPAPQAGAGRMAESLDTAGALGSKDPHAGRDSPWRHREFRALLAVHALNGLASAIPATLVLFFVRDQLELRQHEGLFLLAYFMATAVSVPAWTRLVAAVGLVKVWAGGMALAIAVFAFALRLSPGDALGFALVCVGSGVALGAEVVAPAALLAGVIQRRGLAQRGEGVWFGWWNLCNKLNLALAAGLALPLVEWLGFRSGARDAASREALVAVYALAPCVIKAMALALLVALRHDIDAPASAARMLK